MSTLVIYSQKERVGYITLNRPEKRNALNFEFVSEIRKILGEAEADQACKVIVIEAKGDAFCAGADLAYLKQLQNNTEAENLADSKNLAGLFRQIHLSHKPVISKVEGPAIAGGCGLATLADFCFATPESTFGYTEVRIGFVPALVMVFLAGKLAERSVREILLTGNVFSAEKALAYKLINAIVEADKIEDHVHQFATKLCNTASAQSMGMVKEMLAGIGKLPLDEALDYAAGMNVTARQSEDCKRGIAAFLNKEKINW